MISIIIPTYNSSRFLGYSLTSILKQTYKDWEIIVVDDASQDDTNLIVEKFIEENNLNNRLNYCRHEKNRGVSAAKNTGIKAAKGELISFLDADDIWYPYKLERVINIFSKFPEIDLVCHNEFLSVNGAVKQKLDYSKKAARVNLRDNEQVYKKLFLVNFLSTSAVTVKKRCLERELFDETLIVAEDYDLWLRLSRRCKFYFHDEYLGEYRKIIDNSCSLSSDIKRMYKDAIKVLNKNRKWIGRGTFYSRVLQVYLQIIWRLLKMKCQSFTLRFH